MHLHIVLMLAAVVLIWLFVGIVVVVTWLLRRGRLGPNLRSAIGLLWTAWASVSPGSLRGFLGLLAAWRNRGSGKRAPDIAAVTPWTNNGEISSFPALAKAAPAPDTRELALLD